MPEDRRTTRPRGAPPPPVPRGERAGAGGAVLARPGPRKPSIPDEAESRGIDIELVMFERRLLDLMDQKMAGQSEGLEAFVRVAVRAAMEEYERRFEEKLDTVLHAIHDMRQDAARYRETRETREAGEREARESLMNSLEIAKQLAGIEQVKTTTKLTTVESGRKYRLALLGAVGTLLLALATLIGAAVGSHLPGH